MSDFEASRTLIMVVDDKPEVLEALRMMLEEEGNYQVMVGSSSRDIRVDGEFVID